MVEAIVTFIIVCMCLKQLRGVFDYPKEKWQQYQLKKAEVDTVNYTIKRRHWTMGFDPGKHVAFNSTEKYYEAVDLLRVLEIYLVEDDIVKYKTSTREMIDRSIVGSVLGGKTGAMIGGMTASREAVDTLHYLAIRFVMNDKKRPVVDFPLINSQNGIEKRGDIYRLATHDASKLYQEITLHLQTLDELTPKQRAELKENRRLPLKQLLKEANE